MTEAEFQAILQTAFSQCEAAGFPLTNQQQQLLLQVLLAELTVLNSSQSAVAERDQPSVNPLDELTDRERRAFLQFVKDQEQQQQPWKVKLLNDWLRGESSGTVQFIRDRYGLQWLDRIRPIHLAQYYDANDDDGLRLKVGDRIEVSNRLWEWVQENGPCSLEWFPCRVVNIMEAGDRGQSHASCLIRFENGAEYEIQGVYEWNRPNWRWADE